MTPDENPWKRLLAHQEAVRSMMDSGDAYHLPPPPGLDATEVARRVGLFNEHYQTSWVTGLLRSLDAEILEMQSTDCIALTRSETKAVNRLSRELRPASLEDALVAVRQPYLPVVAQLARPLFVDGLGKIDALFSTVRPPESYGQSEGIGLVLSAYRDGSHWSDALGSTIPWAAVSGWSVRGGGAVDLSDPDTEPSSVPTQTICELAGIAAAVRQVASDRVA